MNVYSFSYISGSETEFFKAVLLKHAAYRMNIYTNSQRRCMVFSGLYLFRLILSTDETIN